MQFKNNFYLVGAALSLMLWMGSIGYGIGEANAQSEKDAEIIWYNTAQGYSMQINLNNPEELAKFRAGYQDDPMVSSCFVKADNAVKFMEERDAGVTLQEHLDKVEARYEATKNDPQGVVPWHVYIDVGRMVRDIHRPAGANSPGEFRYTDPREIWNREFKWCALP